MSRLVVVIRSLILVLLSALVIIVEATWQAPLSTPGDRAVFSVNSTGADGSEFPDETPTSPLRVRVFAKSPSQPKIRPASLRLWLDFCQRAIDGRDYRRGRVVRASEKENSDQFWALRGGGYLSLTAHD